MPWVIYRQSRPIAVERWCADVQLPRSVPDEEHARMIIESVGELWRYPVESMAGVAPCGWTS